MPPTLKPPALRPGDGIRVLSLASPVQDGSSAKLVAPSWCGSATRRKRTWQVCWRATVSSRALPPIACAALKEAFAETSTRAIFCSRGGYGSQLSARRLDGRAARAKNTSRMRATSLRSRFICGRNFAGSPSTAPWSLRISTAVAGAPHGYDRASFARALTETKQGWHLDLDGEPLAPGKRHRRASRRLPDAGGIHARHAMGARHSRRHTGSRGPRHEALPGGSRASCISGKRGSFDGVAGIVLGDFPECDAPVGSETVRDVALRILAPLNVPVVWGAPIGHTSRAMLTLPLGIRAELAATGPGVLRILEPACAP